MKKESLAMNRQQFQKKKKKGQVKYRQTETASFKSRYSANFDMDIVEQNQR